MQKVPIVCIVYVYGAPAMNTAQSLCSHDSVWQISNISFLLMSSLGDDPVLGALNTTWGIGLHPPPPPHTKQTNTSSSFIGAICGYMPCKFWKRFCYFWVLFKASRNLCHLRSVDVCTCCVHCVALLNLLDLTSCYLLEHLPHLGLCSKYWMFSVVSVVILLIAWCLLPPSVMHWRVVRWGKVSYI